LAALIDRIAARIGGQHVVVHLPQDTHIPERAAITLPAQHHLAAAQQAAWPEREESEPPLRPLRLFARPEPIEVTAMFPDGPPARFKWRRSSHKIALVEGPERIAMEWWNRPDLRRAPELDDDFARLHPPQGNIVVASIDSSALTRDYFRAEDGDGARYWIYREGIHKREVRVFRWFLHGMFA